METYLIQSEGAPVVPLYGKVQMQVNTRVTQTMLVGSQHEYESPEFNAQFESYLNDFEQSYKNGSYFTTKDTNYNRNRSFSFVEKGMNGDAMMYDLTISFDIVGAVAELDDSVSTELTGTDRDAFLEQRAASIAASFKADQGWTDF